MRFDLGTDLLIDRNVLLDFERNGQAIGDHLIQTTRCVFFAHHANPYRLPILVRRDDARSFKHLVLNCPSEHLIMVAILAFEL
ncbi:hypothetical protein WJ13_11685 [Burkholderia seminalis]|nr:hypothetical protein WJ13_11685 [Burkholderia seminalis]